MRLLEILNVKQKKYIEPYNKKPNLNEYPIEYLYLNRCLINLGETFMDYNIIQTKNGTIKEAIEHILKINGNSDNSGNSDKDILDKLSKKINILVIGPEKEQVHLYKSIKSKLYILLYHSYEDLYFPIISLIEMEKYVYNKKTLLVKELLQKIK